jgi:molecular chaperone DnaK (HSP70)
LLVLTKSKNIYSVLKYDEFDKTSYRWGFQVKEEEQGKCEWFKLDLYDKIEETSLTRKYHIKTPQQESLNQPSREQMVVDYLRSLVKHVENYLEDKLLFIWETTPREWIITVPAVWPDKSKAKTREYAKMAGMGDNIQIVAEPEAAGIYALQNMRMLGLEVDDTFVVCDAGGG